MPYTQIPVRLVTMAQTLPIIDISPLRFDPTSSEALATIEALDAACQRWGFFAITGHGVDAGAYARLDAVARRFFAQAEEHKAAIAMARGGRAWRGWFPLGGELTSGIPDAKEGLYLGEELDGSDPRVQRGLPLHGPNLFPQEPADLRGAVLAHLEAMTSLGHLLMAALGCGLGLGPTWFDEHLTASPTTLFRIFRYPPVEVGTPGWGVGEHTDYGLLTILGQDGTAGLQVRSPEGEWIDVPSDPEVFICNLGDMLERMTAGRYRSTPHRVANHHLGAPDRLSFPFFFDPGWDAIVRPAVAGPADAVPRWDGMDVHRFDGTYGDYLTKRVAKVFPALGEVVL